MKKPRWTGGSVLITSGSRAETGTAAVRATEAAGSRRMSGSCEFTSQRTMRIAMLLSMIVMITSCAPVLALSTPGMPP